MNSLHELGWNSRFEIDLATLNRPDWNPARVVGRCRSTYQLSTGGTRSWIASPSGRVRHQGRGSDLLPVVGDWVAASGLTLDSGESTPLIQAVLPRQATLRRSGTGLPGGQILAANVEVVLVVVSVAEAPNLRRLERTLTLAGQSGARPVVILSKADLCPDLETARGAVAQVTPDVPVVVTSSLSGAGLEELWELISTGETAVLLGASGAGKSSLVNALLGEHRQSISEVREGDGKGRHTTTSRELLLIPGGGCLLDTPGLRAVGLHDQEIGLEASFAELRDWTRECRYRNCQHDTEPGCRILGALADGSLDPKRWQSFQKLTQEIRSREKRHRRAKARSSARARQRLRERENEPV